MTSQDFHAAGMRLSEPGMWLLKSDDLLGHTRHATLMYKDGQWWCNGLGIVGPKSRPELLTLVNLVFGQPNQ